MGDALAEQAADTEPGPGVKDLGHATVAVVDVDPP
jgi:hypothetical protein